MALGDFEADVAIELFSNVLNIEPTFPIELTMVVAEVGFTQAVLFPIELTMSWATTGQFEVPAIPIEITMDSLMAREFAPVTPPDQNTFIKQRSIVMPTPSLDSHGRPT